MRLSLRVSPLDAVRGPRKAARRPRGGWTCMSPRDLETWSYDPSSVGMMAREAFIALISMSTSPSSSCGRRCVEFRTRHCVSPISISGAWSHPHDWPLLPSVDLREELPPRACWSVYKKASHRLVRWPRGITSVKRTPGFNWVSLLY
jgi:hypothetical protein